MAVESPRIRVKAMLIAPNEEFEAHAVSLLSPTAENPDGYHRLIGGSVEPGETHEQALRREVEEEIGAQVEELQFLACVESIFTIDGRLGHEIVFLYTGRLDPLPAESGAVLTEGDGSTAPIVWRSFHEQQVPLPLYPSDAVAWVHRLPRNDLGRDAARAETVQAYESNADVYADNAPDLNEQMSTNLDRFASLVGDGRVVEIGSGPGRDALALEARGLTVQRTDITPAFVKRLIDAGYDAKVVDPLRDDLGGPYRGVWANAVLLHLSRPEMAIVLHRLRQVVVDGGVLMCTLKEGAGDGWSRHGSVQAARHFTFWREQQLREVLEAAGWTPIDVQHSPGRKLEEQWLNVMARASS